MSDGHKAEDYGTGTTAVGVSFVPWLGAPIAAGIAAWEARRLSKRIEALVAEVARIAAALDESKVDRAFLESEAFQRYRHRGA